MPRSLRPSRVTPLVLRVTPLVLLGLVAGILQGLDPVGLSAQTRAAQAEAAMDPAVQSGNAHVPHGWEAGLQNQIPQDMQRPAPLPQGFHLGVHLNGSSLRLHEENTTDSGGGLGLRLGWGFSPNFTAFIGADAATMENGDYTLGQSDLGVRYHFASEARRGAPYLDGTLSYWLAETDLLGPKVEIAGPAFTLGGGYLHFFSSSVAFDVGLRLGFGRFDEVRSGGVSASINESANTARFNLGISWFAGASGG